MEVKNALMPNDQQMAGFLEEGEGQPIYMVNLLKFKDKATYPDKRETDLTGEEAYAIYGQEVRGHLEKVGAKPILVERYHDLCWEKSKIFGIRLQLPCTQTEKLC